MDCILSVQRWLNELLVNRNAILKFYKPSHIFYLHTFGCNIFDMGLSFRELDHVWSIVDEVNITLHVYTKRFNFNFARMQLEK